VLLSFAQFEREVIGERIRDKIAASKKKGLWMGGVPSLGYDVQDRKLVANPTEAERVRFIYKRYLELGSVPELVVDLKAHGVHTKTWTTQKGIERKGAFFGRGALYTLLRNPVYLGRIVHKEKTYPGTHEPIVDKDLWDRVQALLASHRGKRSEAVSSKPKNLLAGVLFDDRGHPMAPSHATKKGGRRYRYYVSRSILLRNPDAAGSIPRVPAHAIETLVTEHVQGLLPAACRKKWEQMPPEERAGHLRRALRRVELRTQEVAITLAKGALDQQAASIEQAGLQEGQFFEQGDSWVLRIPIRLKTWGGEKLIHAPGGESSNNGARPDKALIKAVARAFEWRDALEKKEAESVSDLARKAGCTYHYVKRILGLAFLAPDIVENILQGKQPQGVNLSHILQVNLPLSWKAQREVLEIFYESQV
jgi:hypothetical protein